MVDNDLIEELDAVSARVGGITRFDPETANDYARRIADIYVADRTCVRWWESLKVPAKRLSYGDADGLSELAKLVVHHYDAILVVTDDEEPPWPVYAGNVRHLIEVLRGCRYFEYIVAAQDMSWIVFDTHMNELVGAGQLSV